MSESTEPNPRTVRYMERAFAHDAIQKILVVIDAAATGHPCVEKAARLAMSYGSALELFICDIDQDVPPNWAGGTTLARYRGLMRERRIATLESLASPLRARGLHVTTTSEWHASFEEGVVAHAIRTEAGLVLKDRERHPSRSPAPADWVLIRQLPMPLLLARPIPWGAHPIVAVSVDPGHPAERPVQLDELLVDLGCSVSRALSGNVEVLHVLESPPHLPGDLPSGEAIQAAHEQQRKAVERIAGCRHIGAGETRFLAHPMPEGIVDLVKESKPAVLVMGVAARQRAGGSVASTASQVLEQTGCDLLVCKPAGFVSPILVTN
ncbi:MAG: universal stress protein [Gammaproteobacteria bacterium]